MMEIDVNADLSAETLRQMCGLDEGGAAQRALDESIIKWTEDYVPYKSGRLAESVRDNTEIGSGLIVYDTPYASRLYFGVAASGEPLNYNTEMHTLAGPFWVERAMADHMQDVIADVTAAINGGEENAGDQ